MPEKQDGYKKLRAQIKTKEFSPVYVFHGSETYLRDYYTNLIQKTIIPKGTETFNLNRFEGKGSTLSALGDSVMTPPVMGEYKLIIVTDFDIYKVPDSEKNNWEELLSNIASGVSLIFRYDTLVYKPDKRTKWTKTIEKYIHTVEFEFQDAARLTDWIIKHFAEFGKTIDRKTCQYFIFRCGSSMASLENEIIKTASYAKDIQITNKDIDSVCIPVLEAVTFDMTDAIIAGKTKEAAHILQKLQYMKTPPEMMLGALAKNLRGMYAAFLAGEFRKSTRELMEVCGYTSTYPAEKLIGACKRKNGEWCRNALIVCHKADEQLKSGDYRTRERVMEWTLASLM